jgi:hypothetical protein
MMEQLAQAMANFMWVMGLIAVGSFLGWAAYAIFGRR